MNIVGIHSRHDSGIALKIDDAYHIIELERIYSERNFSLRQSNVPTSEVVDIIRRLYPGVRFQLGTIIGNHRRNVADHWQGLFVKRWKKAAHHRAHAAAAFYQSPFEEALVISYDGGGNDGYFRTFVATRGEGIAYLDDGISLNLGSAYAALAVPIREIKKHPTNALPNAGKLMGLVAYGTARDEWRRPIRDFYTRTLEPARKRMRYLPELGRTLGLDFHVPDLISGETAYDFAATSQSVFEDLFFEHALPIIETHRLPVCLSGGCALNVVTNEKLARKTGLPIFVPPNPSDCGLALGAILQHYPPRERINVTYAGLPLLDVNKLSELVHRYRAKPANVEDIAKLLASGKIIGVARGGSEHGPRALGNRSLLCDPGDPTMKDRLNLRVKFRESFRPYAPVVRQVDAKKYFDCLDYDLSYMSFNPLVKSAWRPVLPAIVHADNSARVQSVSPEQNPWLFQLLTAFESIKGYGVLLNTSFNTKGKPILSTIAEVIDNLRTTDIDYAFVEGYLFDARSVKEMDRPLCLNSQTLS